jgi:hypothetical protein
MWRPSKEKIGGFLAIKNSETGELELNSSKGFIWYYGDNKYRAIVYSYKLALELGFKGEGRGMGEYQIEFESSKLDTFIKLLGIKKNCPAMAKRANSFGKTNS